MSDLQSLDGESLLKLQILQAAALSPDGRHVAYSLSAYDEALDEEHHHLWLVNTISGETRQLTFGAQKDDQPQWSPDGNLLAFISTRGDKRQIYLLAVDGGEARQLTDLPQGVGGGPAWSPDGTMLAFSAAPEPEAGAASESGQPYRVTRFVYRFDALGYLDPAVQDIYVVSAEGGVPLRLTSDSAMNALPEWSPDGQEILYRASMLPDVHHAVFVELRVVNLAGETRQVLSSDWGRTMGSAAWLPDSGRIAFIGAESHLPIGSKADLYLVNADGRGQPVKRTEHFSMGLGGRLQGDMPSDMTLRPAALAVTGDGRYAFAQAQVGGAVRIMRVALAGAEEHIPVVAGDRSCLLLGLSRDSRRLLYTATDMNSPFDLYMANADGELERRLTSLNGAQLSRVYPVGVEHLLFAGADGVQVEGWLLTPGVGEAPYPTVLYIHGGPHGAFGHDFHCDMQMLAGAGYAVLIVNQRASTGYGDGFATAIKGDWGNLDYGDLMAGVDQAIGEGLVDPDRLGVCGLSGGGNLSCWIVGHTDRFKAAVPENPVTNWVSFYGTSDIGVWFSVEELGGHPHEIPEVYARCSPITYAHQCTTPTLLIQGEADWRCPAEQSEQFYTVLKASGCPTEMVRLPGSSHGGAIHNRPAIRRAQNEALLGWMNRYVK